MTRELLLQLADKVRWLKGPDRGVDAMIAPLVGLTIVDEGHPIGRMCYDDIGAAHLLPRFTTSIDAALTLVPELHSWDVSSADGLCGASVWPRDEDRLDSVLADTPAIALCAAALRALAGGE